MGVAGLWKILEPAGHVRSLTDLAVRDGFLANPDQKRGFRLGIDASIWFFHAEYGREGENPVLRTLFFRCARLTRTTFLPLFVFDGPKRPDFKRGKKVSKVTNKLIPGMKRIVEAFGFEWRTAPGEAEAELAYLNSIGVIDGIMSDDVDNFLFGATTVIRNISNNLSGNKSNPILNSKGRDDKNHTRVFTAHEIMAHPDVQLTRGGMILVGLMSGGDYNSAGVSDCGPNTACALARCGFGDSLFEAAETLSRDELEDFLVGWRRELIQELRTNSRGIIGRKLVALSGKVTDKFPDIDILLSYVKPITSQSMGRESNNLLLTWENEPDLAKLAGACELFFEWGYKEAILKRFRTVMWPGIVLRILRRAVLDQEEKEKKARTMPGTPRRKGRSEDATGTPSKMIAQRFSSMTMNSPVKSYLSDSEDDEEEDGKRLIVAIHSKREHADTDNLLEYRLEISPNQLVELAESGIQGIRTAEGPDEWDDEGGDEEGGGGKKKRNTEPVDPLTTLRVWMPACMVKLVEPKLTREFTLKEDEKEQKKMKAAERKAAKEAGIRLPPASPKPRAKTQANGKGKSKKKTPAEDTAEDVFTAVPSTSQTKTKVTTKHESVLALFDDNYRTATREEEEESEDDELPSLPMLKLKSTALKPSTQTNRDTSSQTSETKQPPKKKKPANNASADLRAIFASSKSTTLTSTTTTENGTTKTTSASTSSFLHAVASTSSLQEEHASSVSRFARTVSSTDGNAEDDGWEEYDPNLWNKPSTSTTSMTYQASSSYSTTNVAPAARAILSSPSKRTARNVSPGWSSDDSLPSKVTKSPRKNLQQSSPRPPHRHGARDTSPSPTRHLSRNKHPTLFGSSATLKSDTGSGSGDRTTISQIISMKTVKDVIELSDSDDELPPKAVPSMNLPPLLVARAKKQLQATSDTNQTKPPLARKASKPKKAPVIYEDVIELSD
ncbi:hypothetical protein CVT24_004982 [Panaeolus cyanescens]|uniref:XPG-I domain-containing protein n=1 Tax=Panaeolus cyanescens TaxID=181874 RepID=A0A409VDV0_9AGAR|nr:hypothetical protein CVT24_004982 [Panaeolus cyanescens]